MIDLLKALLVAGLFAIIGSYAFVKVSGQAGKFSKFLP